MCHSGVGAPQPPARRIHLTDSTLAPRFIVRIAPEVTRKYVAWGAGPRASQYLGIGAKARAASRGDAVPSYDDVRAVAPAVLAHRVVLNFEAEADGRTPRDVVAELIEQSRRWT